ncbi:uncharacterized protein N7487_004773 [Penicillium crustosum]|uniref:uncharacterized protein n=1 Tax=Penicillium crustosum TaxID=36656 RepID=UPI002391254D|nr:uncharacterized protein N7487_004773 [Penicillium crustosum]KAJ5410414.1 hypothetical protein N7487_004773 [Penicillium crustosum]
MSHGIINNDTQERSFIVQRDPTNTLDSEYKFKLTMIDFGHTRFRRQYHPGEDWRWWQAQVRNWKGNKGGGYIYERTPYSEALQNDYMSGELPKERPIPRDV